MRMNERITFQEPSSSIDSSGGQKTVWTDIDTDPTMWAQVQPSAGSEDYVGNIDSADKSYSFKIRHRDDITTKNRIKWESKKWDIVSVDPFFKEGRNKFVLIEAKYQENKND